MFTVKTLPTTSPKTESPFDHPMTFLSPLLLRMAAFTAGLLVLGAVSAAVCSVAVGPLGVEAAAWATGLCLVPGWVVFLCEPLYRLPRYALAGALLGAGLRLGVIAGGALALVSLRPDLPRTAFLASLFVQYMAALTFETVMLMRTLKLRAPLSALRLS